MDSDGIAVLRKLSKNFVMFIFEAAFCRSVHCNVIMFVILMTLKLIFTASLFDVQY